MRYLLFPLIIILFSCENRIPIPKSLEVHNIDSLRKTLIARSPLEQQRLIQRNDSIRKVIRSKIIQADSCFEWDIYPYYFQYKNLKITTDDSELYSKNGTVFFIYIENGIKVGALFLPSGMSRYLTDKNIINSNDFSLVLLKFDSYNYLDTCVDIKHKSKKLLSETTKDSIKAIVEQYIYRSYHYNQYLLKPEEPFLAYYTDVTFSKIIIPKNPYEYFKSKNKTDIELNSEEYIQKAKNYSRFKTYDSLTNFKIMYDSTLTTKRIKSKGNKMHNHYNKMLKYLNLKSKEGINIFWFLNSDSGYNCLGRHLGFAIPSHKSIFIHNKQSIGHEINHILAYNAFGERKSRFLNEGFCTYFDGNGYTWQELAKKSKLKNINITSVDKYQISYDFDYPGAGSFVGYIIENYGLEKFVILYQSNDWYEEKHFDGQTGKRLFQEWLKRINI